MHSDAVKFTERIKWKSSEHNFLRAHDRRSEDLHRALDAGVRSHRETGLGLAGVLRIRL